MDPESYRAPAEVKKDIHLFTHVLRLLHSLVHTPGAQEQGLTPSRLEMRRMKVAGLLDRPLSEAFCSCLTRGPRSPHLHILRRVEKTTPSDLPTGWKLPDPNLGVSRNAGAVEAWSPEFFHVSLSLSQSSGCLPANVTLFPYL